MARFHPAWQRHLTIVALLAGGVAPAVSAEPEPPGAPVVRLIGGPAAAGGEPQAGVMPAPLAHPNANPTPHTRAELVARTPAAARGGAVEIALRLRLDPLWHVYWVNPGDAGLPPQIRWTLPPGAAVSAIHWPAPHFHRDEHGLVSYRYGGEVVLPMTLTLDGDFTGDRLKLTAQASWLVCGEVCLPARTRLTLDLPVVDGVPGPDPATRAWFAAADARRPVVGAVRRVPGPPGRLTLDIDAAYLDAVAGRGVAARVMPHAAGWIEVDRPHLATWTPGGALRVTAPGAGGAAVPPEAGGLIEVRGGGRTLIFRFGPRSAGPAS